MFEDFFVNIKVWDSYVHRFHFKFIDRLLNSIFWLSNFISLYSLLFFQFTNFSGTHAIYAAWWHEIYDLCIVIFFTHFQPHIWMADECWWMLATLFTGRTWNVIEAKKYWQFPMNRKQQHQETLKRLINIFHEYNTQGNSGTMLNMINLF